LREHRRLDLGYNSRTEAGRLSGVQLEGFLDAATKAVPATVGFTAVQLAFFTPIALFLLWALAGTLTHHPPIVP